MHQPVVDSDKPRAVVKAQRDDGASVSLLLYSLILLRFVTRLHGRRRGECSLNTSKMFLVAVAPLVFFTAAARAWLVAADLMSSQSNKYPELLG